MTAEIILHIGQSSKYEDGDVLAAFNSRRKRQVHAHHVCKLENVGRTKEGLRPMGCTARWLREFSCQYKFQRVSRTEAERIDLWSGERVIFGSDYWDLPLFLERRLKHPQHGIFGRRGKEFWYGGKEKCTHQELDRIWLKVAEIEGRLEEEEEFRLFPMGRIDIRHYLCVRTEDIEDDEAHDLTCPLTEESGEEVQKIKDRNVRADWKSMLGGLKVRRKDVTDKTIPVGQELQQPSGKFWYRSKEQPYVPFELFTDKKRGGQFQRKQERIHVDSNLDERRRDRDSGRRKP